MKKHSGSVIKIGDDIDTDIIIPTQYMTLPTIEEMAQYAFSPLRDDFSTRMSPGDIIVAGKNFGCGSSREQAPEIIKSMGIYCVIAKSFARIFYRNALNNGLLLIENAEIYKFVSDGDLLSIDMNKRILSTVAGDTVQLGKMPDKLLALIESGGLIKYYLKINEYQG